MKKGDAEYRLDFRRRWMDDGETELLQCREELVRRLRRVVNDPFQDRVEDLAVFVHDAGRWREVDLDEFRDETDLPW